MKKKDIDSTDLIILSILQRSATITNKELAKTIGLSPPPTLARVNALKTKGVIKRYHIQIDYDYLKYQVNSMAVMRIKEEDWKDAANYVSTLCWLDAYRVTTPKTEARHALIYMNLIAPNDASLQEALTKLRAYPKLIELSVEDVIFTENPENTIISDPIDPKKSKESHGCN